MYRNNLSEKLVAFVMFSLAFTIISAPASGQVTLEKELSSTDIQQGDSVTVTLMIENQEESPVSGELWDTCPAFAMPGGDFDAEQLNLVMWNMTIGPSESREISYTLDFGFIPDSLFNKDFIIKTAIFEQENGSQHSSNPVTAFISGPVLDCDYDGVCDPGESFNNCPQDCFSGGDDGYCDGQDDLLCDPDCSPTEDPDCSDEAPGGTGVNWLNIMLVAVLIAVAALFAMLLKRRPSHPQAYSYK